MSSPLEIGAGIYDITGPAAEAGMFGYAKAGQYTTGIHMRLRSRAFVFHYVPDQQYFVFVSVDVGIMTESVTRCVIHRLQNDNNVPEGIFQLENVMISAVHTHCSPGGLSEFPLYNYHPPLKGFDNQNFECVVNGIVKSIKRAYTNLQRGYIRVTKGLCLGASVNRSIQAYEANSEQERSQYDHDTDKEMVLWRLDGENGFPIGLINWFAVHPTSMGNWYTLITGDNKGLASHIIEREHGVDHYLDKPRSFVAAFAQSNEGDVSPNIFGPRGNLDEKEDLSRMIIVANAQADAARRLYEEAATATPITGPIRTRHQYVDYGNIPLDEKWHIHKDCPPRTSTGSIGISTMAGTTFDGPGLSFIKEGIKWGDYKQLTLIPNIQDEHKEKLIVFPTASVGISPSVIPLQLVTIGTSSLIAVPFEVTTMAGRRLRDSVKKSLSQLNISDVTIAGLSNAYCGYMVTREEYAVQRYEGASTHFGPNQLRATMQQFDHLAQAIIHDESAKTVPPPKVKFGGTSWNTPVIHDGVLITNNFGDIVNDKDVKPCYRIGDTVKVEFHAGHPKNDLRIKGTFLEIHQFVHGHWIMHVTDGDENTFYHWYRWGVDASRVIIEWRIPEDTPCGKYRIKHLGNYKSAWKSQPSEYIGFSSEFEVVKEFNV